VWVSVNTTMEPETWSDIMNNIFDDKFKPKKRRNINTINRIIALLKEGNMNTSQIHEELHRTWPRWCPSMGRLGNILSRNKEFVDLGTEKIQSNLSGSYNIVIWGLADEARLDN